MVYSCISPPNRKRVLAIKALAFLNARAAYGAVSQLSRALAAKDVPARHQDRIHVHAVVPVPEANCAPRLNHEGAALLAQLLHAGVAICQLSLQLQ